MRYRVLLYSKVVLSLSGMGGALRSTILSSNKQKERKKKKDYSFETVEQFYPLYKAFNGILPLANQSTIA